MRLKWNQMGQGDIEKLVSWNGKIRYVIRKTSPIIANEPEYGKFVLVVGLGERVYGNSQVELMKYAQEYEDLLFGKSHD